MLNETPLSRVDLNLLVLFEVVLAERHVGRAAETLKLSPSAVSHGLRRLRDLLNDPLFLKHPKGMVPTTRAIALAEPIARILAQVRTVVGDSAPFDAATSSRRFMIGAADGMSAVILPPLMKAIQRKAPKIDIAIRHLQTDPWDQAFADLDARSVDIAVLPYADIPARFVARPLYDEDFVIAMRSGHPLARALTLKKYCEARHVLVSPSGDPYGFIDKQLEKKGLSRRVALTVPNFMLALATVADTDLIAALPRRLIAAHAARFHVTKAESPVPWPFDAVRAVVPKVAMTDAGIAWFFDLLSATTA
jgi:DNA-binding transcriptional LysR family regulator